MNDTECLAACGRLIPHLGESAQFGWGAFGGMLILFFSGFSAVVRRSKIKKEELSPLGTWDYVAIVFSLGLPILTGFAAQMIEAHSKLLAAFDGVGTATIFYYVAAHVPIAIRPRAEP